jgi:hypothetical protein
MDRGDLAFSVSQCQFGLGNGEWVDQNVFRNHLLDVDGITRI